MTSKSFVAALLALAAFAFQPATASGKEYILTSTKPNTLVLVDPAARKVARTYKIAGPGAPLGIAPSPDGRIAYVVTNHWGSVVGIDLDSGNEVFRADLSDGAIRARNMFGLEVSPDGKELFVMRSPVRLGQGEYEVQDVGIAVYRTDAGLKARPDRILPVPRRTTGLFMAPAGDKLYAVSWDIHTLDPKDGKVLKVDKVANWDRPNYGTPDVFGVWNQYEQAKMFVNPYFVARTDVAPTDPSAAKTGLLTLDFATGKVTMADFEDSAAIMFSSVVNPVRRNEVFSVYNTLTKTDIGTNRLVKRVTLPHTYYCLNISGDGKEVYVAGTVSDIGIYSTETLERIGEIRLPDDHDMGGTWIRMVQR
ncbi:quinohemoprotein amine dehydrogenase subunit beta [Magnetospirillum sp. SS-4]|uniref:quinohemoprotein amine dehydrogenase subunit beta n=1 Tax=Magnetospirillum sp. SS-4 TaxID=2681465 RepID=UPI00138166E7|nr:quinohemoprotein amine dehydrogenase subunit beta [Magnetospirillum sp. SS-4]CAA7612315.1 Quinohemoprotein amine dehydrogenase 40 kDa subunit [Magnetospirillum sp. SS-4]